MTEEKREGIMVHKKCGDFQEEEVKELQCMLGVNATVRGKDLTTLYFFHLPLGVENSIAILETNIDKEKFVFVKESIEG